MDKNFRCIETIMATLNDLSNSAIERQNVLNNRFAVETMQKSFNFTGILLDGEYRYTKQMVANFYEVDISTVNRYLAKHEDELKTNGYVLCQGKTLKTLKLQFGHLINETTKTTVLGLFNFRAFLNLGMLLVDSEKARMVRSVILDIVLETINQRAGGGTKYINRRDINYLPAAITEENYRKKLTSAINVCVCGHRTMKYAQVTDMIYRAVFRENAKEYRKLLRLSSKDNVKSTLYAEVLLVVSSFENGVAEAIRKQYQEKGNNILSLDEVQCLINNIANAPMQKPYLSDARSKMASRDLSFRNAYHGNIEEYLRVVTPDEFERFIGDKSIEFDEILEENKDILKRLKQASVDE